MLPVVSVRRKTSTGAVATSVIVTVFSTVVLPPTLNVAETEDGLMESAKAWLEKSKIAAPTTNPENPVLDPIENPPLR
jgi:hypothetical protein